MNTVKSIGLKLAFIGTLAVSSLSVAAGPNHNHDGERKNHQRMMMHKLDLTDAQKEKMKAFKKESRESMVEVKKQIKALKKEMHQLMRNEEIDRNQLTGLLQQQATLKADLMIQKHASHKEMNSLLTEEQRVKMKELREKAKQHHQKKKQGE